MGAAGAVSRLYIANANKKDSGNYSCALADVAAATMVSVHVLNGMLPARVFLRESASDLCVPKRVKATLRPRGQRINGGLCWLPINVFGESCTNGRGTTREGGRASHPRRSTSIDIIFHSYARSIIDFPRLLNGAAIPITAPSFLLLCFTTFCFSPYSPSSAL